MRPRDGHRLIGTLTCVATMDDALFSTRGTPRLWIEKRHKSSWILYRYVPAGGTAGRWRKFHRGVTPSRERRRWLVSGRAVGGYGRMKKTEKEEKVSLSGEPSRCWREDVTVDAPKLNLSEREKNVWLSGSVGERMRYHSPIFDHSSR